MVASSTASMARLPLQSRRRLLAFCVVVRAVPAKGCSFGEDLAPRGNHNAPKYCRNTQVRWLMDRIRDHSNGTIVALWAVDPVTIRTGQWILRISFICRWLLSSAM